MTNGEKNFQELHALLDKKLATLEGHPTFVVRKAPHVSTVLVNFRNDKYRLSINAECLGLSMNDVSEETKRYLYGKGLVRILNHHDSHPLSWKDMKKALDERIAEYPDGAIDHFTLTAYMDKQRDKLRIRVTLVFTDRYVSSTDDGALFTRVHLTPHMDAQATEALCQQAREYLGQLGLLDHSRAVNASLSNGNGKGSNHAR